MQSEKSLKNLGLYASHPWPYHLIPFLGIWLLFTLLSFPPDQLALTISDGAVGVMAIFLGCLIVRRPTRGLLWTVAGLGMWLQVAPLIFWAPHGVNYLNDTVTGILLISASILFPEDGNEKERENLCPPGWNYNPSSFRERYPVLLLAFLCWLMARYMAAFQLGYLDKVWDPFFADGTLKVITSDLSKAFPISDAGLGAAAYTIETLMCLKGGASRWKTNPWFVFLFGFLVIPVGLISIVLIILQPIVVHAWCSWCLATAFCLLGMVVLTLDEVVAACQNFFRKPSSEEKQEHPPKGIHGVTFSWSLIFSALLGIAIVVFPFLVPQSSAREDTFVILGALITVISIVSMADVAFELRYLNILLAVALMGLGWISETSRIVPFFFVTLVGVLLILLAYRSGKKE